MTAWRARLVARLAERAAPPARRAAAIAAAPAALADANADREPDELDAALADALAAGEARLPHRPVPCEQFVDRIADCLAALDAPPSAAALRRLHAAELYLACALGAGDPRAIALAEAELIPAARRAIARIDSSATFIDEIVQRLRDRLLVRGDAPPAITQYRGSGPLGRWVAVVASRLALDAKRAEPRTAGTAGDPDDALATLPGPDDPELALIWQTCAAEYKAALAIGFASLSKRDRNLLRQRYIDELDIDVLGRLYRVHPATAFRWLKQAERALATATRNAVIAKLSLTESQAHSMERLIASQLPISIARLLRGR